MRLPDDFRACSSVPQDGELRLSEQESVVEHCFLVRAPKGLLLLRTSQQHSSMRDDRMNANETSAERGPEMQKNVASVLAVPCASTEGTPVFALASRAGSISRYASSPLDRTDRRRRGLHHIEAMVRMQVGEGKMREGSEARGLA